MAESTLSITYQEIRNEVGYVLGYGLNTASSWNDRQTELVDMVIRSGLKMFYSPAALDGVSHEWTFMRPIADLTTTAPYSTGTIEIASGVVTLTTGTWPSWAAQGDLVTDGKLYTINTRDSDSQLTMDDTTVTLAAGATYEIRRYSYDLADDYGGLDGPITYQPASNVPYRAIKIVGENRIRQVRQGEHFSTYPEEAAIRSKVFDATVGSRYELLLWPAPDAEYQLQYRYKSNPDDLTETNKYPLGGFPHAETIKAACLAAAERESDEVQGVRYGYYMERLQTSIAIDRQENGPKHIGINRDRREDQYDVESYRNSDLIVRYTQ